MKYRVFFALLYLSCLPVFSSLPESFTILDMDAASGKAVKTVIQTGDYFINVPLSLKKNVPFLTGEWNYNEIASPHKSLQTSNPFPLEKIPLLVPRGEYGFYTFFLRTYQPLSKLSFQSEALRSEKGELLPSENILIARIAQSLDYPAADILVPADMRDVPDKALLGFAVLVNIPRNAREGTYHTRLAIRADGFVRELALNVRVPDFDLPEADIPMGSYIPYYASDQGGAEGRWAAKDYTSARQKTYFRFCATRGMNSPTIFHYCPEFESADSAEIKFDTLDRLVEKIVSAGSCKAILFDLREPLSMFFLTEISFVSI